MKKLTNAQASELFQTINQLELPKGSHLEYSVTKTLRKMKDWQAKLMDKIKDIDDENCATDKNDKGVEIRVMETLKRTSKDGEVEEYQVPTYTKDGEKNRTEAKRKLMEAQVSVDFEIHSTSDGSNLKAYQKLVLEELGFYKPEEVKENATPKNKETTTI